MSNLAFNKLPLEKEQWIRPEQATNGDSLNYTGNKGFAHAIFPCTFTIDLEKETNIDQIRFLLWDGLGNSQRKNEDIDISVNNLSKQKDKRKYKFSLSISSDNVNYLPVYSNYNESGDNGWFIFNFLFSTYARFVRVSGHNNSANAEFHIVELEVHDTTPDPVNSTNTHEFYLNVTTSAPNNIKINEIVDQVLKTKNVHLDDLDEKIKYLNIATTRVNTALGQLELLKKSTDYLKETEKNIKTSRAWLGASIIMTTIFFALLACFIYLDDHSENILLDAASNSFLKNFAQYFLFAFYISKALLLSTLLFVLGWFLKNYRSEKHNYIVNKHKAMSLTVAISLVTNEDLPLQARMSIFNEAMNIIFSHQPSGYSSDDTGPPNIINTLMQKDLPLNGKV